MNNQEKRVFIKCACSNLFPSEVLRILPVAETCSRHLSSAARGGRGWGSRKPASGVFQAQGGLKIDRLHLIRKLWRPQNQAQAPALSEVSVAGWRERRALVKSWPDRIPKLLRAVIPSCFPDPSALSLPCPPQDGDTQPLCFHPNPRTRRNTQAPALRAQICAPLPLSSLGPQPQRIPIPASPGTCRIPGAC